ncbi:hypothetical protein LV716_11225 [Flagellimonas sp. HMM57]|uniref:hypothetical protein n=1 Tax=unclassified Flagellimonas TaxID=2644544 RepID=UPI0013CFBD17|nr:MULTISPECIES: hypothetical protein [unclassified Flagellimonas]UII74836.1 hypothetical protein LV716_11225 [Flagellimonas sp. HMM57]
MTYRIKSLIYLSCFIIVAILYYDMEQEEAFQDKISTEQMAGNEFEDDQKSGKLQDEVSSLPQ